MAVHTVVGLRASICILCVALLVPAARARAEDAAPPASTGEVANPAPEQPAAAPDKPVDKGEPPKPAESAADTDTAEAICLMIESAARANDLPLEFFARVIWQESRFQSDAVGPMTRRGQRAQGIAQFMPGTADERRLLDPFDPVQALPKSAEFLRELRAQFGNLGLAAAAYNAGPRRVQEWLAGTGAMPQQTRNYVAAITGVTVDEWARVGNGAKPPPAAPNTSCQRARSPRQARRRPAMGRAACRRLQSRHRAGELWPRDDAAARRDRRPGSEPARLGIPQPRLPNLLSGEDRRRHPPRRRRSLQPHPPRRRRLLRAAQQGVRRRLSAGLVDSFL